VSAPNLRPPAPAPLADRGLRRDGFVRLREIIGPNGLIPVSRSAWYAGIQAGIYPKGVRIGRKAVAWRRADIDDLMKRMSGGDFDRISEIGANWIRVRCHSPPA
jgi:predicted DNA-binding transcriptional regulator AlpA